MALLNKYTIATAALLLALAALWGYGRYRYHEGVTDTQTAAKIAAAAQYAQDVARINAQAATLQAKLTELENASPKIVTQYRDRVIKVPLPADCRIDPDRLHNLQAAVQAANAAR
ncbi:hypothetical protein [Candidimonas nitroreducens]|uniref:Uncharacterized protein n=1 Tax=Candidimonas nitroreducens TaxID=683354 RepID=A0A225MTQ7_9BURK|nr:hypothetical protein [Candidimonas nitroreducens]OWT62029.1 hypothetical protein CEY11_09495 [Candidimonas nitroreducens]